MTTEKGTIEAIIRIVDTTEGMMIAGMTVDTIVVTMISGMIAIAIAVGTVTIETTDPSGLPFRAG